MTAVQVQDVGLGHRFPVLDTLRFVGALAVLTTHTAFWAGSYTAHGAWGTVLARLDVGVAIFFVLSGFLLSRPWIVAAVRQVPRPPVGRYYWKRALRILPVYLVTAVIALSLIPENDDLGPGAWARTLLLADIYLDKGPPDGLTQMWSLATELAFYLVLPLLMLLGVGRTLAPRRLLVLLVTMWAVSLLWLGGLSGEIPGAADRAVNEWLPAFLGWFAVGILLALVQVLHATGALPARVRHLVDTLAASPGSSWIAAFGLLLVAATPLAGPSLLVPPSDAEAVTKNVLYAGVGGLLVFSGVFATPAGGYARAMSLHWLRHLGHISYGIFCIHLPVLHLVMGMTGYTLFDAPFLGIWALTLGLSLVAAEVLYRVVERPAMRFREILRSPTRTKPRPSATSTR